MCLPLCDPIDGSPPGSSVLGIFQARILEWVAISFSNSLATLLKLAWTDFRYSIVFNLHRFLKNHITTYKNNKKNCFYETCSHIFSLILKVQREDCALNLKNIQALVLKGKLQGRRVCCIVKRDFLKIKISYFLEISSSKMGPLNL